MSIALTGPAGFSGPLTGTFGHHSLLLPVGSYELSFAADGDYPFVFAQTGYAVWTVEGITETRGFDVYTFLIYDAPVPGVPEPATWSLATVGLGLCLLAARRRRRT